METSILKKAKPYSSPQTKRILKMLYSQLPHQLKPAGFPAKVK
jgi:hypothetical protein